MALTNEEFIECINDMVQHAFKKDPGEHETWEDMLVWMVGYFQSEDMAGLSTEEMAEVLVSGFPAITAKLANKWFLDQLEGQEDIVDELHDDLIVRVRRFLND